MRNEIIVDFADETDMDIWMNLVEIVKDDFPGLVTEDYKKFLKTSINQKEAFIVKNNNNAIGILIFLYENKEIAFLAVDPKYRKNGVATALIEKVYEKLPKDSKITVTTYRENDEKGKAARAFYKKLGFIENMLVTEFGYPCQKLILNKKHYNH